MVNSQLSLGTRVSNLKFVALTVLQLLAFNAQKFRGSRDVGHAPFWENFGGHVRTVLGNKCVKFEVHRLTVLELLAFNAHKFRGSRDPGHAPFWENFWVMSGLSLGTRVSNLKSVGLTVLELLAFNSHRSAARTHTDRQTGAHTSNEHNYLRLSLRSLGGDKYSQNIYCLVRTDKSLQVPTSNINQSNLSGCQNEEIKRILPMKLRASNCIFALPRCQFNLYKRSFVLRSLFEDAY